MNTSASKGTGPRGTHTITTRATDNGTSFTDASFTLNLLAPTVTTVTAGPDIDAANNDYRRIQNALNAAASGDTIILSGTFDFTQPFAAAAWALGNDNTASTADDYEVLAPRGVNNVTLTATSLGSATIQGPGDLAAVNLESFLVFDPSVAPGGTNQGWTITNLRILDFDLSIGMFAVGVSDFNNTIIQSNFIRIPTDLNATVAPADFNQNIGINFSFGTNQTISNNGFQIAGDGVSDTGAGNFSTSVVMQSTQSGGAVYNGLTISNNVIHVLNAQSANPEVILGIWDECHAHTSNITISNNSFLNDAVGNSPSLNLERAFRVTSHSGATSTVTYSGNTVNGANIGYQWLAGSNFSGNLAVRLIDDTITNCDTGVLVQSNGVAHLETDVITGSGAGGGVHIVTGMLAGFGANLNGIDHSFISGGSGDGVLFDATATTPTLPPTSIIDNDLSNNTGFGLKNLTANPVTALTNYWGSNLAANVAAKVSGPATFDPWLASGTDISASTGFQPFIYATTTTAANLTTLAGTAAADTGSMLNTSPVTLTMDGDTGFVPVAELLNVSIQLGNSDDVFTLGQTGIPTVLDGGTGNDTLVGTNVAQTWNITGGNSGNIPGAASSFSNVESLRGGTAADSFVFGAAGSLTQTIDGNLGTDTLNNSAIPGHTITPTGPGTLDGFKGTATGVGVGFDNINNFPSPSSVSGTKTASGTFAPNGSITYTVVLSNSSTFAQLDNPGDEFTDVLPAGLTLVSANATSGTATTSSNTVDWNGSIPASSSVTITINATVNSNAGGTTISNQGTINYDADGNGTNESSRLTDDPAVGGASDPTSFFACGNSIVVTINGNSGAGSLRQAILDACPGATITFDVTVTSPITVSSELVIDKNLTIQGPTSPGLTISGNNASRVFNINAGMSLAISNLTIDGGRAAFGGGIYNQGALILTSSTISNNKTTDGSDTTDATNGGNAGDGGGIYSTGPLTLINSTISGNKTGRGGDASGSGNGGNSGNGGGIYHTGALTLTNTTVTKNQTGRVGAPVSPNTTGIPGSTVGTGGGIFRSGGTLILNNTIVADNRDGFSDPDDISGTVDSASASNLIGSSAGLNGISNGTNGNQIGQSAVPLSPQLGALADNGGPTKTHLPQQLSPAIDAGSNALAKDQSNISLATDQRGAGFDRILNGTVEIGAVEVNYGPPGTSADVGVIKSSSADSALADTNVTYTITVSNGGPNVATNATLTDTLPAAVTFVSLSSPGGWSCTTPAVGSGGIVSCTNASLPLTAGAVFTLVVHIIPGATPGNFITNQAQVATSAFDANNENDSSAASTLIVGQNADLGVTKLASADTSPADRDVRYTITVINGGPAAAANVALNDTLPGDMTFVSLSSPAGWSCASHPAVGAGGTVTCTNPSLAVTSGQVFTLTGHIPLGASNGTFYFNQ
ncbi:MAG TPA: choice-of-anchor Q domain-containing protein, partial [Gemmatimonadaceae bacterium]